MTAEKPLVLMMAGGTGGHVYPALAVATELRERGYRVEWLGTDRGLEARVVPEANIKLHCLAVRGVRGKNPLWKIIALLSLAIAAVQALWLVFRLAPKCVIGLGGYVSGPAGIAAWLLRKPLIIHEQNAVAGTTNRLLAPFAAKILAGFPAAFSGDLDVLTVGNPVRSELVLQGACGTYDYDGKRPLRLLVLGGSLGARPINELMPAVVAEFFQGESERVIELRHQCGEAHYEAVRNAYGSLLNEEVAVFAFIDDMAASYAWADLVLCRAGALTVSELAIMGRPSILVPLPHAIDDHQSYNARSLSDCGAAILLRQAQLSSEALVKTLRGYMTYPQRLLSMAEAALAAANPNATGLVCDTCEELIHGH